jgi:hypothetical protein
MPTQRVNVLEAEVRSVENDLRARLEDDGRFTVRSVSRPGLRWTVRVGMVRLADGWRLKFSCECESGTARPSDFISCHHSAAVGRSLERRGLARWVGGLFEPTEKLRRSA